MHTAHCLGVAAPPLDVVGGSTEERRIVAERSEGPVVGVAEQAPETGGTTPLRRVAVTASEDVVMVDREHGAQRFATDRAEAALSGQGGAYLQLAKTLAGSRWLPRISGG
jgi:hypothetical protein